MGYRSTVGIKCQSEAYRKFKAAWEQHEFTPDKIMTNEDQTEYLFIWDWVKWYHDYEEVKAIENVMGELDEYDDDEAWENELAYRMINLCEDDTDVSCRENNYDIELFYIRSIDTNGMVDI